MTRVTWVSDNDPTGGLDHVKVLTVKSAVDQIQWTHLVIEMFRIIV